MKFFLFLLFFSSLISSCGNKYENILKSNTSEIRKYILAGCDDKIKAELICGYREQDYVLNGISTPLVEFGILSFDISRLENVDIKNAKCILFVGTDKYEGDLEKNPFEESLVVDFKQVFDFGENFSVQLIMGEDAYNIKLKPVNKNWKVYSDDVYKIIVNEYKKELKILNKNNKFIAEVYVKILNDGDEYQDDYYWYFSIISVDGRRLNVVISPYTGKILSSMDTINKNM